MTDLTLILTRDEIELVIASLRATQRSGGGSPTASVERKLARQCFDKGFNPYAQPKFVDNIKAAAERCIDEAIEAGVVCHI